MRVSITDTGPALEAIAQQAWGDAWAGMHMADRAVIKQDMLTYLLPGMTLILDQINAQLAEQEQSEPEKVRAAVVKELRYCADVMVRTDLDLGIPPGDDMSNECEVNYLRNRAEQIEQSREPMAHEVIS